MGTTYSCNGEPIAKRYYGGAKAGPILRVMLTEAEWENFRSRKIKDVGDFEWKSGDDWLNDMIEYGCKVVWETPVSIRHRIQYLQKMSKKIDDPRIKLVIDMLESRAKAAVKDSLKIVQ